MGGRRMNRSNFEHDRRSYAHKRVGFAMDATEREETPEKDSEAGQ